jgi:hypothetical protein
MGYMALHSDFRRLRELMYFLCIDCEHTGQNLYPEPG